MKTIKLEDFEMYQLSMEIGEIVWDNVNEWEWFPKETVGKQLVKSADSIAANIAEGYGRFTYKDRKHFMFISRGSLMETKSWLTKANHRNFLSNDHFNLILQKMASLHLMMNIYIKTLNNNIK